MSDAVRKITRATTGVHGHMETLADAVGTFLVVAFHYLALFAIGGTTVWSAAAAFAGMVARGHAGLSDILLLFIYLEIGAMVGIYFKTTRLPVRYLIYITITALSRVLIELVMSGTQLGRPLATNAGVPAERVVALRAAFAATMKDPEFLAEAKALNFDVEPVLGERMQQIVEKVLATPAPIAARAKALLE